MSSTICYCRGSGVSLGQGCSGNFGDSSQIHSVANFFRGEITDPIFLYQKFTFGGSGGCPPQENFVILTSELSNCRQLLMIFF